MKKDSSKPIIFLKAVLKLTITKRNFLSNRIIVLILFFIFYSCQKEKTEEASKQLEINKLFSEDTHGDKTKVYANDSLFCIYRDDDHLKVWKNGILLKDHQAILPLIKGNDSTQLLRTYKFQSELMNLDFKKYSNKAVNWDTKDYQIRKRGEDYFLYKKGYSKLKLPIRHFETMDWITFNSMDINNDNVPELFIFNESYNDREDLEYGKMIVYEIQ